MTRPNDYNNVPVTYLKEVCDSPDKEFKISILGNFNEL